MTFILKYAILSQTVRCSRTLTVAQLVEMDLFEAGFDAEFEDIAVPDLQEAGEWEGILRPYWALQTYKLPTCKFLG
jgi:hypothetical protein